MPAGTARSWWRRLPNSCRTRSSCDASVAKGSPTCDRLPGKLTPWVGEVGSSRANRCVGAGRRAAMNSGLVAIAGRPNVGKSTLVNALCGGKVAIVSDKPQTTRRRILGVATGDDYQLVLADLP